MRKTTVWVVDDDSEFLAELREALELSGYAAEAFPDAASVKQRLRETVPDVLLLDLKMDGQNGFELVLELKRLPRTEHLPVIAMTGHYTSREHASLLREGGISLLLVKPLNLADVIDRIALVTGISRRVQRHAEGNAARRAKNRGPDA